MSCGSVSKHVCVCGGGNSHITWSQGIQKRRETVSKNQSERERERDKISSFQGILKFVSNETFNSIVFFKGLFYF